MVTFAWQRRGEGVVHMCVNVENAIYLVYGKALPHQP